MILEGEDENNLSDFEVTIEGVTGTIVSVPGVYTVHVTEISTGNSCWGTISVEDKLPPIVEDCACPPGNTDPDCSFLCTDLDGILAGTVSTPQPDVVENCSGLESDYIDAVSDGASCGQKNITRTWTFTDGAGNEGESCVQEFTLEPVDLGDVDEPTPLVEVPCGTNVSMPGLVAYFTPLVGTAQANANAYPSVNGLPLKEGICNLVVTKNDLIVPVCDEACSNSIKVIRDWLVLDWCEGEARDFSQVIKAVDNVPPTVTAADITVSTDPWMCEGTFFLPEPTTLTDDCTDFVEYTVTGPFGTTITYNAANDLYLASGVPKGNHTFTYVASDCCDNIATADINVSVEDQVAPVAIAKEYVVVTLTNGGTAKVFAPSIDNGSHDGCTDVHLEVRRDRDNCNVTGNSTYNNDGHPQDANNDPDDGEFVKFCCADATAAQVDIDGDGVNDVGYQKVWLRVWDDADMNQQYGTAGDNYNETWAYVKVEDKLAPTITCPPTAYLDCGDDVDDLSLTGTAVAMGICEGLEVDYTDNPNLNDCGVGTISRRWFVVSNPQIFCIQTIDIDGNYYNGNINFPSDYTTNCIAIGDDGQIPTWGGNVGCSHLGYSLESDTFTIEDDACLKIYNRWTVIDWCRYNPNATFPIGIWTDVQIIKVLDDEDPVISCADDMQAVDENCELENPTFSASAMDVGDCPSPWLKWRIFVDLYGDGTYDYEFSTFLSPTDNSFNDSNNNGIPDRYIAPTSPGELAEITLPIDIPSSMANHKIEWKVSDGCGNFAVCNSSHMIVDKKKPTPYCMSVSSALMENGMVELWACDFDLGSFDNCTEQGDLRFTFTDTPPHLDPDFIPSLNCSSKAFTCADIAESGHVPVRMYVWDEKGEYDYCEVILTLIDNQGACGGETVVGTVSGKTLDPSGGTMANIAVSIENVVDGPAQEILTDENGGYLFTNIPTNIGHRIYGKYDENYRQGVNTLDLVLIQRHILGLETFTDVHQTIAADITNDEDISPADLLTLRKLILGLTEGFPSQESYLVIDANHTYDDIHSPWPLANEITISDMSATNDGQDLMVVKVGDVNMDGFYNLKGDNEIDSRSNVNLALETVQTEGKIALHVTHPVSVAGLQMVINLDGAKVKDVTSEKLNINETMYTVRDGKLYLSVASAHMTDLAYGDNVLTLHTSKEATIGLANDANLTNEAYIGNELKVVGIEITNRSEEVTAEYGFELGQNEPNPFKQTTTFTYVLPTADVADIVIYDLSGKQISSETVQGTKGLNTHTVDLKSAASGVYYYTINTTEYSATKKMILID